jgi:hypothetical protein
LSSTIWIGFSDEQIEDICEGRLYSDRMRAAGVLLAPPDFLARLERPAFACHEEIALLQFRFREVGDGEAIVLHNQLVAQRDRRTEVRGFRRGILTGLDACGVVSAASIGAFFILHPTIKQIGAGPATAGPTHSVSEEASMLRPVEEAATSAVPPRPAPEIETTSAFSPAPPSLSAPPPPTAKGESPPAIALPTIVHPPSGPRLSPVEITTLLERGDTFFSAGDITSARLFYERARPTEKTGWPHCGWERPSIRWFCAVPAYAVSPPIWLRLCPGTDVQEILAWSKPSRGSSVFETPSLSEQDTRPH